ncbi:MAG: heavy metal-responsive transcriptional regulator [Gammaproteobacteria bacterium]|nr:heavy metal-responsive transcriptional regulator [Gammaproteobacteria bacterium]MDE1886846.1 heavy metal-responsive transcriptional regulator [Gammaproteobacteria bacterium]MDE2023408.1 heavy metal-responsive transcriptional regulator [Gammaproteobacteria bacterium]MDE2138876.1 heavy metal-responsive transcriptional regulator [Gammaproteobacteria bacterium]MDE2274527.1 heavy metal-responsive transcriptional regulator [Gammaproteobacteria bacterium]
MIGKTAEVLGLSPDTLRYYEKIGLVPRVGKNRSGRRTYSEKDMARLKFVQRAQSIGFSLAEIGQLLKLRENPLKSSKAIRAMAQRKCADMQKQIRTLKTMEAELTLLLNLCSGNSDNCPILERLDSH